MRMWMIDPALLCRKHLLGEHNEIHMLVGSILKGKSLEGFVRNGLLEARSIASRHEALAREMEARGYKHNSPLPAYADALEAYPEHIRQCLVDTTVSMVELRTRCQDCAVRIDGRGKTT